MASIKIKFRDGSVRDFPHKGRTGGSYTKKVLYEGRFVIVEDEWGNRTSFPESLVQEVIERPDRGRW